METIGAWVEQALRSQRQAWQRIGERLSDDDASGWGPPPSRVLLFGQGSSLHAAALSARALRKAVGDALPVVALPSTHVGRELLPLPSDWAFGLSHRGSTARTLEALQKAARAGAFTVLVCAKGVSRPDFVARTLETCELERVEPHTVALTSAICAVTRALGGSRMDAQWRDLEARPEPAAGSLVVVSAPTLVVGEWEGEWLAREAALKVLEMARVPARAYSSEELFHGPHHALGPDEPVWHFAVPGDPRTAQLQAARRFEVDAATPLGFVPALLELQWAALGLARALGVDPDRPAGR